MCCMKESLANFHHIRMYRLIYFPWSLFGVNEKKKEEKKEAHSAYFGTYHQTSCCESGWGRAGASGISHSGTIYTIILSLFSKEASMFLPLPNPTQCSQMSIFMNLTWAASTVVVDMCIPLPLPSYFKTTRPVTDHINNFDVDQSHCP